MLSGILLHPTSLPGRYGIGELGKEAIFWLDWLQKAEQKLWQVLPLGHTSYGDSPYQCFSAFAGNPLLISLDKLIEKQWLNEFNLPNFPQNVDYCLIYKWKWPILRQAFTGFLEKADKKEQEKFTEFQNNEWLDEYALFMALKDKFEGRSWLEWPKEFRDHDTKSLENVKNDLEKTIEFYKFVQYIFFEQWHEVKSEANKRNIKIIGDVPIFVALDSADVWANPELFKLDNGPIVVAGVPPDYFSATGQRWGNPIYRWDLMEKDGFSWWLKRLEAAFDLFDIIRIDHFRGFEAYWEIPANEETAINGKWVKAPGHELLSAIRNKFGHLSVIAEDLGIITPEVEHLRDEFGLPGMKILQFAFDDGPNHPYLPHMYPNNCVVYTGTHDNDTTLGWFLTSVPERQEKVRQYLNLSDDLDISWALIKTAWRSKAEFAIAPMQDLLNLGSESRMNIPGTLGNWTWRLKESDLNENLAKKLKDLTEFSGR